jgi:hypothetical protein
MKKIVRLTEQDLVTLVKKVIKEQSNNFKAQATVEGDMVMEFPVVKFKEFSANDVEMTILDPVSKEQLVVVNFMGKITINGKNRVKYTDSYFSNISLKNWNQIASKYKIPVLVVD